MSRGGRVQHHESVLALVHGAGEARNTAISSVQGERRSSSSRARPWASRSAPARGQHLGPIRFGFRLRVDAADGQSRRNLRPRRCVTCAAGSVVVRWTRCPCRAKSTAMAAATVVLPTPPLPIVRITPRPAAAIWSMSVCQRRAEGRPDDWSGSWPGAARRACPGAWPASAATPIRLCGANGNSVRGNSVSPFGIAASASCPRCCMALGNRIVGPLRLEHGVHHQVLIPHTQGGQLAAGSLGFAPVPSVPRGSPAPGSSLAGRTSACTVSLYS